MARRRGCTINVHISDYVDVDIGEVIEQITNEELLKECRDRKIIPPEIVPEPCDLEIVREAYAALLRNRANEARCILDRILFPKWKNVSKCDEAYKVALKAASNH